MAIPQAGRTYNEQQTPVRTGGLSLAGLGQGLNNASVAWDNARKIQDNTNAQLAKSETEFATWQMEDWSNEFLRHMNKPELLKRNFQGTQFEAVMNGIPAGMNLLDSSNAQAIFFRALDAVGANITDENVRNNWNIQMRRNWEPLEQKYIAQADAWRQNEVQRIEFANLESLWAEGYSTDSIRYNSKLDEMLAMGLFGAEAATAYENLDSVRTGHRKREHTALVSEIYRQEYMPYARNTQDEAQLNIIANGVESLILGTQHMGDEERAAFTEKFLSNMDATDADKRRMSTVIEALATSGFSLTPDEMDKIKTEYVTMGKNYADLYNNKVDEGRELYYAEKNQAVVDIMTNPDYAPGERLQLAQNMINGLNYEFGTQLPEYETGVTDVPVVDRGYADTDKTRQLIDRLSKFVSSGGDKIDDPQGQMILQETISAIGFSRGQKAEMVGTLYLDGRISGTDYKSAMNKLNTFGDDPRYIDAQERVNELEKVHADLSGETLRQMRSGVDDIFMNAGLMHEADVQIAVDNFLDSFADKKLDLTDMINSYQDLETTFWAAQVQNPLMGDSWLQTSRDFYTFQSHIDKRQMAGWIQTDPQMFAEYSTRASMVFTESVNKNVERAVGHLDLEGLVMNERNEPVVVGNLVDPWGNALIVVPVAGDDPAARYGQPGEGQLKVRVFQPTTSQDLGGRRVKEVRFTELTDNPNGYYITATDENGMQVDPVKQMQETGGIPYGYNLTLFDYTGFSYSQRDPATGRVLPVYQMRQLNHDPNFLQERLDAGY